MCKKLACFVLRRQMKRVIGYFQNCTMQEDLMVYSKLCTSCVYRLRSCVIAGEVKYVDTSIVDILVALDLLLLYSFLKQCFHYLRSELGLVG